MGAISKMISLRTFINTADDCDNISRSYPFDLVFDIINIKLDGCLTPPGDLTVSYLLIMDNIGMSFKDPPTNKRLSDVHAFIPFLLRTILKVNICLRILRMTVLKLKVLPQVVFLTHSF
jgi:hypothetical protein